MTNNRLGFKQFLKKEVKDPRFILDANILIAYFFEDHRQHEQVKTFLGSLDKMHDETEFYSTITIKSEFLEFRRRQHLTEGLLDLVDEVNQGRSLSHKAKAQIYTKKGLLSARKKQNLKKGELPVEDETNIETNPSKRLFFDIELKDIKKAFRARDVQSELGWVSVCKTYLKDKLESDEKLIDEFCDYLTTRKDEYKENIFNNQEINWKNATFLCSSTGMSYSDAMILNIFTSSNIPFLITLDYDLVYSTTINAPNKTVLLPDGRLSDFKLPLKKAPEITNLPMGNKK